MCFPARRHQVGQLPWARGCGKPSTWLSVPCWTPHDSSQCHSTEDGHRQMAAEEEETAASKTGRKAISHIKRPTVRPIERERERERKRKRNCARGAVYAWVAIERRSDKSRSRCIGVSRSRCVYASIYLFIIPLLRLCACTAMCLSHLSIYVSIYPTMDRCNDVSMEFVLCLLNSSCIYGIRPVSMEFTLRLWNSSCVY